MTETRDSVYHNRPFSQPESLLFLTLILIEFFSGLIYTLSHFIPRGHDGLHYFIMQYYFLNNAVLAGETPHWIPYITHGTVANWFYMFQAGLFQNVLLLLAPAALKGANFLPLFYFGMFIDKLILITGLWLFSRRFFQSSATIFFVCLTISTTSIWFIQPWYNLHLYYALPLILHFLHRLLETGRWRYFLLAGNLLALQMLGNLAYFLPIQTLAIFIYFLSFILMNRQTTWIQIQKLFCNWRPILASSLILLTFGMVHLLLNYGNNQVLFYTGRAPDGTSSLHDFLHYGLNTDMWKWMELVLGISSAMDFNLYTGVLTFVMLIAGLIFIERKSIPFLIAAVIFLMFHAATFVSVALYHVWPMMKYYRHLALIAPLIKFFLCFIAGFAFERILVNAGTLAKRQKIVYAIILCCLGAAYTYLSSHSSTVHALVEKTVLSTVPDSLPQLTTTLQEIQIRFPYIVLFSTCLITSLLFFSVGNNAQRAGLITLLVLAIHTLDLFAYTYFETQKRTYRIPDDAYNHVLPFQDLEYPPQRIPSFYNSASERTQFLMSNDFPIGQKYWSINAFSFIDTADTIGRTDFWLSPVDDFMRAYWGQQISDKSILPKGMMMYRYDLLFPKQHPAAAKMAGITRGKIQFFRDAAKLTDRNTIAANIIHPQYTGDFPFILTDGPPSEKELTENTYLPLEYQLHRFDSNNLMLSVDNPSDKSIWMVYSDVWDPAWKATINGAPTKIYQTNLAYKALEVRPGKNTVAFRFFYTPLDLLQKTAGILSLLWIIFVGSLVIDILQPITTRRIVAI